MSQIEITDEEAQSKYGVSTKHGRMPNGELRFRLTNLDGNNYIRTEASETSGWQNAHKHKTLHETYIVENGWMALAEKAGTAIDISLFSSNDVVTTRPNVVHNVYLPANAVVHTVKHGSQDENDWHKDDGFTDWCEALSEDQVLKLGTRSKPAPEIDERFEAYVALYNNLDNLIWRIPGFLAAGAAILIGFAGAVLSKEGGANIPPLILASLFFFVGLLFFLSAFSMSRIREHHTMVGDQLALMEPSGYFQLRRETVKRRWPPSATLVFRFAYSALSALFIGLAILAVFCPQWLAQLLR